MSLPVCSSGACDFSDQVGDICCFFCEKTFEECHRSCDTSRNPKKNAQDCKKCVLETDMMEGVEI